VRGGWITHVSSTDCYGCASLSGDARHGAAHLCGRAFLGSYALIRTQTTIGDRAFTRSMIPHHSGAILMCQEASLRDPELKALCGEIIKGQRREIDQMKAILPRL